MNGLKETAQDQLSSALAGSTPLPNRVRLPAKAKLATICLLALAVLCSNACGGLGGVQSGAQSGIVGKWRSADGSYNVEFLANGNCAAHMRLQGRDLGGPCTYTAHRDTIDIHYPGMEGSNATTTWQYSLSGDTLNVSVFGNSLVLRRIH